MLCLEGIYYGLMMVVSSLLIGIIFSQVVVGSIMGIFWMFSYHFTLMPILIVSQILLVLGAVIPLIVYHGAGKKSIVERLREAE